MQEELIRKMRELNFALDELSPRPTFSNPIYGEELNLKPKARIGQFPPMLVFSKHTPGLTHQAAMELLRRRTFSVYLRGLDDFGYDKAKCAVDEYGESMRLKKMHVRVAEEAIGKRDGKTYLVFRVTTLPSQEKIQES